jgi:hypothetical protein
MVVTFLVWKLFEAVYLLFDQLPYTPLVKLH